jgi:TPR repeat protein
MRVASNREFFRGPPAEVVRVVLEVAARNDAGLPYVPEHSATEWLSDGDRFLFGMGDTLQDLSEALRCYRAAARRGSMVALERLGAVYSHVRGNTRADRRRAMRYLKEGAKRGNYYCYAELARMYAAEDHQANFVKAWDLFFSRRAQSLCDEVEAPSSESEAPETRYAHALRRYLVGCIGLGLVPLHVQELKDGAEPLVRCLAAALDIVRDAPETRFRLAAALRWSYENLLPGQMAPQRTRWLLPAWFTLRRRVLA